MVTRRLDPDSHGATAQVTSSDSSDHQNRRASSSQHNTPSTSPSFTFGRENSTTPTFSFGLPRPSEPAIAGRSTSSPSSPQYTPSSTLISTIGQGDGSTSEFTFSGDYDADTPLPSVERDTASSDLSREGTPTSAAQTPSHSTGSPTFRQGSEHESVTRNLDNLRLASTSPVTANQRASSLNHQVTMPSSASTPSIQVTPTPPAIDSSNSPSHSRADSLVNNVDALHLDDGRNSSTPSRENSSLATGTSRSLGQEGISRSPSPGRRRRSGSSITQVVHQVENEDPPSSLFYQRDIQGALTTAKDLVARMVRTLSASALNQESGSTIQRLHQQASLLSAFQLPASRIVGLVGDSGVGKSSLINSLLDKKEFARASNSGAACTCVVTEYHFHDRQDFLIRTDYFTLDEVRAQFEELLGFYRQYHSAESEMLAEEREEFKKREELALNTFKASFRTRLDNNPELLLSLPLEQALDTMMTWTTQILSHQGPTQETFDTDDQCSSRLKVLTSEMDGDGQICLWPFIKKLRVYLKAHILSKGLIIADLPGLRDLNVARQNVTERYVRECHQIFAVARIGRATTDPGVKEVFTLARRASLSNVGIICTQSDDIRPSEARNDWPRERASIKDKQRKIDAAKQKLQSLIAGLEEFNDDFDLTAEDTQELLKLQRERSTTTKSIYEYQLDLDQHIINFRNRKVTTELEQVYRTNATEAGLRIFCISNIIYWKNRALSLQDSLEYLQLSNILDLRRYCIGIVAESHLRATEKYIRDEIPAFLGSVQLWIEAGSGTASAERKQQVLDVVSTIEQQLDDLTSPVSQISDVSQTLNRRFDTQVQSYMRQHRIRWSAAARDASMEWQPWHYMSFKAFSLQYGDHYTRTIGSRCWNEEAMETMTNDMSTLWDAFENDIYSYLAQTKSYISRIFAAVLEATQNTEVRNALRTLTGTLQHRRRFLVRAVENVIEDFRSSLHSTHTDAFSPIRTSIVGKLMESSYHAANMEYGTGCDRRRKTIITNGFGSRDLFNNHRRRFEGDFVAIADKLEEKMKEAISQQLVFIETDLTILKDENVVEESERNPEFRRRLAAEVESVKVEMQAVLRAVEGVAANDFDAESS